MIARVWRGWTLIENADAYERLLREQVLPSLKQIDGYRGGYILRQEGNDEVEFVVMNLLNRWRPCEHLLDRNIRFQSLNRKPGNFSPKSSHLRAIMRSKPLRSGTRAEI